MTNCKNCENSFEGSYCNICGQKKDTHRINLHYVVHELPHALFHLESGIFFTIREMLLRPGINVSLFLEGKRVRYFKPVLYLLVLTTVSSLLNTWLKYLRSTSHQTVEASTNSNASFDNFVHYITTHPGISLLGIVPLISLITKLFFKKKGYNYWEHTVINTYVVGTVNIFYIVFTLFKIILSSESLPSPIPLISLFIILTYLSWAYYQVFSNYKNKWWTLIKCIITPVLAFFLIIVLVGVVFGLLKYFKN